MDPKAETPDPTQLAKVYQEVAERSSRIFGDFAAKQAQSLSAMVRDEMGIAKAYMDLYARMARDPSVLASASINWWVDSMRLWQSSWMKMLGMPGEPVADSRLAKDVRVPEYALSFPRQGTKK